MPGYKCKSCEAVVRRGAFCSRCGGRQRPRVLRGILAAIGTTAVVVGFAAGLHSLGPSIPHYRPPAPSGGKWASEEEIGPLDLVPDAPSPFAPISAPATAEHDGKSQSQP